jgi:hypothetical protein
LAVLHTFEGFLEENKKAEELERDEVDEVFLVGGSVSYVDFALFLKLEKLNDLVPHFGKALPFPRLGRHFEMIGSITNVAEYLASDRRMHGALPSLAAISP